LRTRVARKGKKHKTFSQENKEAAVGDFSAACREFNVRFERPGKWAQGVIPTVQAPVKPEYKGFTQIPNSYSALQHVDKCYRTSVIVLPEGHDQIGYALFKKKYHKIFDKDFTVEGLEKALTKLTQNHCGIPSCAAWDKSGCLRSRREVPHSKEQADTLHKKITAGVGGRLWRNGKNDEGVCTGQLGNYRYEVEDVSDVLQDAFQVVYQLHERVDSCLRKHIPKEWLRVATDGAKYEELGHPTIQGKRLYVVRVSLG